MAYEIWHRTHGAYMGHRRSKRTGRMTPYFSWKFSGTSALTYETKAKAEAEIAAKGLERCTAEELKSCN